MNNKSKIRRLALNLLYALEENGGGLAAFDLELFWGIALEKEKDHFRKSLYKSLAHAGRASADTAARLRELAQTALNEMQGDMSTLALREEIQRLLDRSGEWESAFAALHYCAQDKKRDSTDQLEALCNDVMRLAHAIAELGKALLPPFEDFPAYRNTLEPLAAAVRRRNQLMNACAALSTPRDLAGQGAYAALVRNASLLEDLRPAAEQLALPIIEKRSELDARLEPLLQNYSLARLDTIDRCILYISLYELETNKLQLPIVVSEATALADAYSGSKSAPFIHGVLSAAAGS